MDERDDDKMSGYFSNIGTAASSLWDGMRVTMRHFVHKKELNATLQFPRERWPIPERAIGFEESGYNSIRTRLHVDMDDCIGCLQCERACPVNCIEIEIVKTIPGEDLGKTTNGKKKAEAAAVKKIGSETESENKTDDKPEENKE